MSRKGMLINYDYCTGCHSCEVACRVEHGFPDDQGGIAVMQVGPWEYAPDQFEYAFMPVITDQCDQCKDRLAEGKDPMCVHHCQAAVMTYGDAAELGKEAPEGSKSVVYVFA